LLLIVSDGVSIILILQVHGYEPSFELRIDVALD